MRRILLVLMIAAVGMLVAPILPAMADSQEEADFIVFFPYGNGGTYSCTGGPRLSLTLQGRATALLSKSEACLAFCAMFLPLSRSCIMGTNG